MEGIVWYLVILMTLILGKGLWLARREGAKAEIVTFIKTSQCVAQVELLLALRQTVKCDTDMGRGPLSCSSMNTRATLEAKFSGNWSWGEREGNGAS